MLENESVLELPSKNLPVFRSVDELNRDLQGDLVADTAPFILIDINDGASFIEASIALFERGYVYLSDDDGKAVFALFGHCDPKILSGIWDESRDINKKLSSLRCQLNYEIRLKEKALSQIKSIKSSRRFKVASFAASIYRRVAYPARTYYRLYYKVRAIVLSKYSEHRRKTYEAYIHKLDADLGHFEEVGAKLKYIEKWLINSGNAVELENCYWLLREEFPVITCYIGWALWRRNKDNTHLANNVKAQLTHLGKMYELRDFAVEFDEAFEQQSPSVRSRRIVDEINHLEHGFPLPSRKFSPTYVARNHVLYLLHNSLPYNSGGYATRTHGLLSGINELGDFIVTGVSRPGFPSDHKKYISKPLPDIIPHEDYIDNVSYLRCDQSLRKSRITFSEYVTAYASEIERFSRERSVGIIHAASNFPNAFAAICAARKLGIKSVYEVRGLWEVTRLSRQEGWDSSEQFKYMAKMEAEACLGADAVITITEALKQLMVSRGVPSEKITVVPNCVHTDRFSPLEKDQMLANELGISDQVTVIGYIGSIVNYEGLDDLLCALRLLLDRGVDSFCALIVGDGAVLPDLKRQVAQLGLKDYVVITGRVPHEDVQRYYSLVDITPFPRKPYEVCEKVSPLKPFEAMASQKAVIVSSCSALTEIVESGKTGLVFEKGNIDDFSHNLEKLLVDSGLRKKLGEKAREWVCSNRDWKNGSLIVNELYEKLLNS